MKQCPLREGRGQGETPCIKITKTVKGKRCPSRTTHHPPISLRHKACYMLREPIHILTDQTAIFSSERPEGLILSFELEARIHWPLICETNLFKQKLTVPECNYGINASQIKQNQEKTLTCIRNEPGTFSQEINEMTTTP